ncbi:Pycsar system effector family protein [Dietzia cinnamea]|uniref:Pycsar system effector family protein n=1 Tax=Dietzia cinnamea TaxID=321318 RepID=UPI00223BC54F|nr:Pycsar system effector family protein [Dietzia cinnamea]MCT2175891.1 DUF5706 domain-containing protein [Dietzia cinnamea]
MTDPGPIDTAWRIHSALIDWTGKVDTKASFALTLESAILAGVVTLSGGGRALSGLTGFASFLYWAGIAGLAVAALFAIWVVRPQLRTSRIKRESATNFIYFGHLSLLEPVLVETMLKDDDKLPVLSKQLVEMSRIAWNKHRNVQWSLTIAPIGVGLLAISAAL